MAELTNDQKKILKEYEDAMKVIKGIKVDPKKVAKLVKGAKQLEPGWKEDPD